MRSRLGETVNELSGSVRVEAELALEPEAAFDAIAGELPLVRTDARVVSWQPGEQLLLEWQPADWGSGTTTEVEVSFEPIDGRTRVVVEHRGFASEIVKTLLGAGLGDWVTDRRARRPSGPLAHETYRDPIHHRPNFKVILRELALTANDLLLEVGCGGGALLEEALASGCRAKAIDHSTEMVELARETNREAVEEGRLEIVEASAERLPFRDETFTCAAMTGVLGFLPDPVAALAEIRRVLVSAGRFICLGSDPALRGTPAAPEPMASRLRFYEDDELERLGWEAGFSDVRVERHDLYKPARDAGVPEEHLGLFAGPGAPFLLARR
jgi:SAM-dependent methyltransferase